MESFIQSITNQHIWESDEWNALKEEVPEVEKLHLRELLQVLHELWYLSVRTVIALDPFLLNIMTSF